MYKERFTEEDLLAISTTTILQKPNCADVEAFEGDFRAEADKKDEAGDIAGARALRLLAAISNFHFRPGDKAEPFSNALSFADGSRTLVGSDFDEKDVDVLGAVAEKLEPLALKVRICDLVWTRDKSRQNFARIAIDGYTKLVEQLKDGIAILRFERSSVTSVSVQNFLERAINIARSTGWDRPENDKLREALLSALEGALDEGGMAIARFGNLGLDYGVDGTVEALGDLNSRAETLCANKEFHQAIALQELSNRIAARTNEGAIPTSGHLALAKIYESQADAAGSSAFLQTHALQQAIDALHGARGVKDERQRLHERLKDSQLHFADEMQSISHSMDISDEVQRMLEPYKSLDLLDALRHLALTEMPKAPDEMYARAKEEAEKFPLASLFATSLLDNKGRTVARTANSFGDSEPLRYKVIQQFGIKTDLAVSAAIVPARAEITNRFFVDETLLAAICAYSPFVPSGYEHQVARGLHAFLYGDDMVACSILVPFLEAGLRALVSTAGYSDTTIALGGIEQSIGLGRLLGEHRDVLEQVFGKAQIFAIENLFVHELGPKVRHNFCHGMSVDGAFYSASYIYGCKLIFSLVMLPLVRTAIWKDIKPRLQNTVMDS
ncbi:DUF7380 domain-containing protein [Erythrobacter alti]|uniref:DUF7380 domain-containing protein n=1 Tax=Erythrobacter alti TaxID=1896145 RepID=UPI0030F3DD8C